MGVERFIKTKQYETIKTFSNMKKLKLSQKTQDYFWGVMFTISALLWIYVVSFFL
jgi:hypothetical protein